MTPVLASCSQRKGFPSGKTPTPTSRTERSQGRVREAAMKLAQTSLLRLRSCAFHKVYPRDHP
jgi:hypothetical protein